MPSITANLLGWVVVLHPVSRPERFRSCVVTGIEEVLSLPEKPKIVAVDMPIGLLEYYIIGGRGCEKLARKMLQERGRSVFPSPVRGALSAKSFDEAKEINARSSAANKRITKQVYGIFPKLRDAWTPSASS